MAQRSTIDETEKRGSSGSHRAKRGEISVIRKDCKHCNHHKAFNKSKGTFCTRCGGQL